MKSSRPHVVLIMILQDEGGDVSITSNAHFMWAQTLVLIQACLFTISKVDTCTRVMGICWVKSRALWEIIYYLISSDSSLGFIYSFPMKSCSVVYLSDCKCLEKSGLQKSGFDSLIIFSVFTLKEHVHWFSKVQMTLHWW